MGVLAGSVFWPHADPQQAETDKCTSRSDPSIQQRDLNGVAHLNPPLDFWRLAWIRVAWAESSRLATPVLATTNEIGMKLEASPSISKTVDLLITLPILAMLSPYSPQLRNQAVASALTLDVRRALVASALTPGALQRLEPW